MPKRAFTILFLTLLMAWFLLLVGLVRPVAISLPCVGEHCASHVSQQMGSDTSHQACVTQVCCAAIAPALALAYFLLPTIQRRRFERLIVRFQSNTAAPLLPPPKLQIV